jgi:hypothetical protein
MAVVLALVVTALVASVAAGDTGPSLSASPASVRYGHAQTIRGSGWPVIEFCSRQARLALLRPHQAKVVGFARTRTNGTWSFRWTPRRSKVPRGYWTLRARMRCESGRTGGTVWVRALRTVRFR